MNWLDDLKKTSLSGQTRRHLLNLVSRFFSWAIERGLATENPVKMIPQGKRPKPQRSRDVPWLDDDTKVPALMQELGPVVGLMFYLGNRSGLPCSAKLTTTSLTLIARSVTIGSLR